MRGVVIKDAFWRDSARSPRFLIFSAYIAVPLLVFLFHIKWWTFIVLVLTIILMTVIEYFGYTPPVAVLALRSWMAGKKVTCRRQLYDKKLDI